MFVVYSEDKGSNHNGEVQFLLITGGSAIPLQVDTSPYSQELSIETFWLTTSSWPGV